MIEAIWKFFFGYVVVELQGNALERLLNRISASGIELWDIQRIKHGFRFKMMARDYYRLRPMLRYRKCTVRICQKKGLPFITFRTWHRKALIVGILVFFILLKVLASFLWFIQIEGSENVPASELQKYVDQVGIHRGMPLKSVDLLGLEQLVRSSHPGVAWVDAHLQGTLLTLKIVEKKIIDEVDLMNVIAEKPAVITQLMVFKGKPMVKEGDTVSKGDILIKAANKYETYANPDFEGNLPPYLPSADEPLEPAEGIVKGRTWYEGYGESELIYTEERLTGRSRRLIKVKIGPAVFHYAGPRRVEYEHYRVEKEVKSITLWRNITLPIEIINEDYHETVIYKEKRSLDTAKYLAKEQAMDAILKSLSSDAIIKTEPQSFLIDDGDNENNIVRVKVIIEVEENIAEPLPMTTKEEGEY